jgi:hypothetical protein
MKWALVMMAMGTTPIQTNLVYDDLQACYAAEEKIGAEYTNAFNQWIKANGEESLIPPFVKQRIMRGVCVPHQSTVSAQNMETPPELSLEPRQPDAMGQSDRGDVADHAMQKQVINLVAALKNIKTLARAVKDSDDVAVLRKNIEMTLTLVDKALPRARKGIR